MIRIGDRCRPAPRALLRFADREQLRGDVVDASERAGGTRRSFPVVELDRYGPPDSSKLSLATQERNTFLPTTSITCVTWLA